jgi:hypothetical protein
MTFWGMLRKYEKRRLTIMIRDARGILEKAERDPHGNPEKCRERIACLRQARREL